MEQLWDNVGDNFADNSGTIWRQLGDNLPNSGDLNDNTGDNTAMEQAGDSGPMILGQMSLNRRSRAPGGASTRLDVILRQY